MAEFPEFAPDEPISPLEKPEFAPNEPVSPLTVSQRQRAFREQIRMGQPEQAAQISYGGEKLAAPMPEVEQPKTGMFLGTDEQGRPVAVEQPITGGEKPQGILERMSQAAKAGLGEEPFGISPETQKKYPWASTLQLAAYPADVLLRGLNAFVAGGAGAVAGAAEEMGMSSAMANRLQRDIYQAAQVAAVEMPKPTPGMMTRPIVRAAEAAAPTVETVEMMTGKPPVPKGPAIELPTIPAETALAEPRSIRGANVRLLSPDTPHELPPTTTLEPPTMAPAGAASISPLADIHPESIKMVRRSLIEEGFTPETLAAELESMSPHQFGLEVGETPYRYARGITVEPGQGNVDIINSFRQRAKEAPERINAVLDRYIGEASNTFNEKKLITEDQKRLADPAYKKFRELTIAPTEELKSLIPRLERAGAFNQAEYLAGIKGVPWEKSHFTVGPQKVYPTAESWDLVKRSLDSKISSALKSGDRTSASALLDLKQDLVNAIDNHPNPEVAGVWAEARNAYAGPQRIKDAIDFGKKLLTKSIDVDEFAHKASFVYNPEEIQGILVGLRKYLKDKLGGAGGTELSTLKELLAPNNMEKLRSLLGEEQAANFAKEITHEFNMHNSPRRITSQSETENKKAERALWEAKKSPLEKISETAGAAMHPVKALTGKALEKIAEKAATASEREAAKIRNDAARIYTMQGPERDAALRWILEHGENWIGAPEVKLPGMRSSGGSVLDKMHAAKRRADGGPLDGPFDEAGVQHTAEGYPYIQAGDVVEAPETVAAPAPAPEEPRPGYLQKSIEGLARGVRELPGTVARAAEDYWAKTKEEQKHGLEMAGRGLSNIAGGLPATGVGEVGLGALQYLASPITGFEKPVEKATGSPEFAERLMAIPLGPESLAAKTGIAMAGAGVGAKGVLGAMQAAKAERELTPFSVEVKPVFESFNDTPKPLEMKEGIIGEITKSIDQSSGDIAKLPTTMGLGPMYVVDSGVEPVGKGFLLASTNNKNAAKQIDGISPLISKYPDMATNPEQWAKAMTEATGNTNVVAPPYRFAKAIQNGEYENLLKSLTEGQIKDRTIGFENGKKFLNAYTSGQMDVADTGKLFMWGILSRGVDPFTHEGLFLDAFNGIEPWVRMSAEGRFTKEIAEGPYKEWAATTSPKGSGQAGSGAMHNLNAFGRDFLVKMGTPGENGITPIQRLHDLMSNPELSGRDIRREFAKTGEGVGIDNKVVSFILLATGRDDVMVIDRIQLKNLWDDGRYGDFNIWDGISVPVVKTKDGKVKRFPPTPDGREAARNFSQKNAGSKIENAAVTGSSLAEATYGAKGILIYEAIEDAIMRNVKDLYAKAGIPGVPTPGMFHWDTWVARSNQEASHGTLGSILAKRQGVEDPLSGVYSKQGDYQTYAYGAKYAVSPGGPHYKYPLSTGEEVRLSPSQLSEVLEKVKNPKYGVVPKGFKVSETTGAPWYERKEVNRAKLDELLREASSGQISSVLRAFGGQISNGSRSARGGSKIERRERGGLTVNSGSILHKMMEARRGQR